MQAQIIDSVSINDSEKQSLSHYVKTHNTAVLTVMFTDIQGYTELTEEKGDNVSAGIRALHDETMRNIIEANDVGLIIKFIGDAVMAVFAEPSAAVAKAIEIQQAMRKLNEQHEDLPPIKVRIGLHMGQVSIEDNVQVDIFGRHVNRAARIEGLAQGGQVLMSYAVYDSAHAWIVAQNNLQHVNHGRYQLKGIKEPVDVCEVYEKGITVPVKPAKGRVKDNTWMKVAVTGAFAIGAGVALTYFMQGFGKAELWIESFYPEQMQLADGTLLHLAGEKQDARRLVTNELSAGKHIIFYSVGHNLRYYTEIELQAGHNQIYPKFNEWRLPSLWQRLEKNSVQHEPYRKEKKFEVLTLQDSGMMSSEGVMTLDVTRRMESEDIHNHITGRVTLDGKEILTIDKQVRQNINNGIERFPEELLWESDGFQFTLKMYTGKGAVDITLDGKFKPIKAVN